MLPGPPPNLVKYKIKISHAHNLTAAIELAGLQSHRLRNTVTNDSIALSAQPLLWGRFRADSFCVPGKRADGLGLVRTDCPADGKNGWLRASNERTNERNSRESEEVPP